MKKLAIILSILLIIGFTPINDVRAEGDTLDIYASELNKVINGGSSSSAQYLVKEGSEYSLVTSDYYGRSVSLILDEDINLSKIMIYTSKLYISGSSTLTINSSAQVQNDMSIASGSTIVMNSANSYFSVSGDINCYGNIVMKDAFRLYSNKNFYLNGGSIKGTVSSELVNSDKGSIYIESGSIDITSSRKGLNSNNDVIINGGNIKISCKNDKPVYANNTFRFNGGYLEASTTSTNYLSPAILAGKSIVVDINCMIKEPKNGYVNDYYGYKTIFDETSQKSNSVILKEGINLENATISGIKNKPYTGSPITQAPVVTYKGTTLTEGVHYTVKYEDNVKIGTAAVIIEGIIENDVTGKVIINFQIKDSSEPEDDVPDFNPSGDGGSDGGSDSGSGSNPGGGGSKGSSGKYCNEWVNGKWYNANGVCDYNGTLSWKSNASGWWVEDTAGWYPVNQWQKIDGKYYFFTASGYMDYSEYRDGCWLGSDGAWVESYYGGHWASDATGWWYADASGWYPQNQWVWIDGYCYYFQADGYMATNTYIDGCWVGADGAWQ